MTQRSEKELPEILVEEDNPPPFHTGSSDNINPPTLPKEAGAETPMDLKKFTLGSSMLGWCLALMLFCIILSIWNPENELIKNGFEAFKLIVMTILGYIFGSNNSKSD